MIKPAQRNPKMFHLQRLGSHSHLQSLKSANFKGVLKESHLKKRSCIFGCVHTLMKDWFVTFEVLRLQKFFRTQECK